MGMAHLLVLDVLTTNLNIVLADMFPHRLLFSLQRHIELLEDLIHPWPDSGWGLPFGVTGLVYNLFQEPEIIANNRGHRRKHR